MMGVQQPPQSSLFYVGINIDKRIRKNHPLRKVHERVDFDFAYNEVKDLYGNNGNVSVPPPIILKLMRRRKSYLLLWHRRSSKNYSAMADIIRGSLKMP